MYYLFLNYKTVSVAKALLRTAKGIFASFQISVTAMQNNRLTPKIYKTKTKFLQNK